MNQGLEFPWSSSAFAPGVFNEAAVDEIVNPPFSGSATFAGSDAFPEEDSGRSLAARLSRGADSAAGSAHAEAHGRKEDHAVRGRSGDCLPHPASPDPKIGSAEKTRQVSGLGWPLARVVALGHGAKTRRTSLVERPLAEDQITKTAAQQKQGMQGSLRNGFRTAHGFARETPAGGCRRSEQTCEFDPDSAMHCGGANGNSRPPLQRNHFGPLPPHLQFSVFRVSQHALLGTLYWELASFLHRRALLGTGEISTGATENFSLSSWKTKRHWVRRSLRGGDSTSRTSWVRRSTKHVLSGRGTRPRTRRRHREINGGLQRADCKRPRRPRETSECAGTRGGTMAAAK